MHPGQARRPPVREGAGGRQRGRGSGWGDARGTEKEAGEEFQAASAARPYPDSRSAVLACRAVRRRPWPGTPGARRRRRRRSAERQQMRLLWPHQATQNHRRLPILRPFRREGAAGGQLGRGTARLLAGKGFSRCCTLVVGRVKGTGSRR
ncbi:unnamed protein product [Coccothraustes coccothraustes]